jgi:hypothetical protein
MTTQPTVRPPASSRPQPKNGAVAAPDYVPVQTMGLAGSQLEWAANGTNLWVTADGGQTWRSVTPPNLSAMTVSEHITAVDAVGTDDLWVVIEDVPGLVPYSQSVDGSDRGEGIDRSTDGGRTWTFSAVPPECLQTCGPISVSFVDAEHGYAEASPQSGGVKAVRHRRRRRVNLASRCIDAQSRLGPRRGPHRKATVAVLPQARRLGSDWTF